MEDYYKIANVTLKIEHDNDDVFKYLDSELSAYKTNETEYGVLTKIRKGSKIEIPKKAIRTNVFDRQSIYSHNQRIFVVGKDNDYAIVIGTGKKEISLDYTEDGEELRKMLRWLIKWAIILSAQKNGLVYLHASAARYNGKNVIFCGDSHCGKSSSLLRLIQDGAKVISDDSVLFDGKELVPFSLSTRVDSDLEERFNIDASTFDVSKYVDHELEYGKADVLVFLKIWNNETSEIREMDYNRALLNLTRIYKKEIPFLWEIILKDDIAGGTGDVFKKYASLLEGIRCVEFYAGHDEEEVRGKLLGFLNNH
jgi:hypothetical protein